MQELGAVVIRLDKMKIISNSPEETIQIGCDIGKILEKGSVISLSGEIGAGKTTLIKGIAKSIGLEPDDILSPYFNILFEYSKDKEVIMHHFDFMRLKSVSEIYELNIAEILESSSIVIMEWASKFPEIIPANAIMIDIDDKSPYQRIINLDCNDENIAKKIQGVQSKWTS